MNISIVKNYDLKTLLISNAGISNKTAYNYKKTIKKLIQALISHEAGILIDKSTGDNSEKVSEYSLNIHEKKVIDKLLESYTKYAEVSTSILFNENYSTIIYKNRRLIFVLEEFISKIDIHYYR